MIPNHHSEQLTGFGSPADELGEIGDFYMDTGSGELFKKTGAKAWVSVEQFGEQDQCCMEGEWDGTCSGSRPDEATTDEERSWSDYSRRNLHRWADENPF